MLEEDYSLLWVNLSLQLFLLTATLWLGLLDVSAFRLLSNAVFTLPAFVLRLWPLAMALARAPVSLACNLSDVCSDGVNIRGVEEVSCFTFCKKRETVSEYLTPPVFKGFMLGSQGL